MIGQTFNRLTVVESAGSDRHKKRLWRCLCECGNTVIGNTSSIKAGRVKSCGCLKSDLLRERWAKYREPAFWSKVDRSGECWKWTAATDRGGYGIVGWEGVVQKAHRVSWRLQRGPIPKEKHVLHVCDNTLCVNPDHLWIGTHADNMHDMAVKGRRLGVNTGAKNGRAKLTQKQADEIRRIYANGGRSQQTIADEFGVSQFAISQVVNGRTYA